MLRRLLRRALVPTALLAIAPAIASAQVSLPGFTPSVQDFNGFAGTAATVPANWTVGGTTTYQGFFTSGTSPFNGNNGWYALNDNGSLSDVAFGARCPVGATYTLTVGFRNDTGQAASGFNLSYKVEQYFLSANTNTNTITLLWSADNSTFSTANLTGDLSTSSTNYTDSNGSTLADPLITSRTATLDQTIPAGSTFYLRFSWNPGGGGNRPQWGVDDVSLALTPVPEPGAIAAIALGTLGLLRRRRR